jgi:hypothetical protein
MLQGTTDDGGALYWAWNQPFYTQALHSLLQRGQLLVSLPPATVMHMAITYWIKAGSLESMVWVGQLMTWLEQHTSGALAGASAGQMPPGPVPPQVGHPGDVLSIQVHPWLQPYLDLAPATGPQAAIQRFLQLQVGVARPGACTPYISTCRSDLRHRYLPTAHVAADLHVSAPQTSQAGPPHPPWQHSRHVLPGASTCRCMASRVCPQMPMYAAGDN